MSANFAGVCQVGRKGESYPPCRWCWCPICGRLALCPRKTHSISWLLDIIWILFNYFFPPSKCFIAELPPQLQSLLLGVDNVATALNVLKGSHLHLTHTEMSWININFEPQQKSYRRMPTSPADHKSDQHKPTEKDFDLEKIQRLSKVQIVSNVCLNNSLSFWQPCWGLFPKSSPSSIYPCLKRRNQWVSISFSKAFIPEG